MLILEATFQGLVRGISAKKEAEFWRQGIESWELLEGIWAPQRSLFREEEEAGAQSIFDRLKTALKNQDIAFFAKVLGSQEHYRIALSFPQKVLFLDIETTGLSKHYDQLTLVGWSHEGRYGAFIQGHSDASFRAALEKAPIVVTFNGSLFDLPFLREKFPGFSNPIAHIDLRFFGKRLGFSGGQKSIEDQLGFRRPKEVRSINGEAAPLLWHQYRRGDREALKSLMEYNYWDIEGMKYLFDRMIMKVLKARRVPNDIAKSTYKFAPSREVSSQELVLTAQGNLAQIKVKRYSGSLGPAITLKKLNATRQGRPLKVVGIDLTGSEARLSGWCSLDGASVVTRQIGTDQALIEATLGAKPDVVSIDSPLSLPKGRTMVSDDDPGRKEFGIMRTCERILKRRGINVYPALIPSMQKLTARGMQLAARFRSLGFPVIESYPGAAQDIMGIPRKRASLEMLRDGLGEFGVTGDFLKILPSHDELDAITSAVVGVFFWSGRFEALGSEDEEALIIPHLHIDPTNWIERSILGFSGPIAAGKTTSARFLEGQGYRYVRYSEVLADILRSEGKNPSRSDLQAFGEQVHTKYGQRWLGRKLVNFLGDAKRIVIDGLRFPDDHAFLVEQFGPAFRHVHVTANIAVRKSRFEEREDNHRDFRLAEEHSVERKVSELDEIASDILVNEGDLNALQKKIIELTHAQEVLPYAS